MAEDWQSISVTRGYDDRAQRAASPVRPVSGGTEGIEYANKSEDELKPLQRFQPVLCHREGFGKNSLQAARSWSP